MFGYDFYTILFQPIQGDKRIKNYEKYLYSLNYGELW